jgi:uncharacterized protein
MLVQPKMPLGMPTPETQPFWDGLGEGRLLVQRCAACGKHVFYPRRFCPNPGCHSEDREWVELTPRGTVYSYSVNHISGLAGLEAPYAVCLVDFGEDVRILGRVVESDLDELRVGAEVEPAFERISDGEREQTTLCFRITAALSGQ